MRWFFVEKPHRKMGRKIHTNARLPGKIESMIQKRNPMPHFPMKNTRAARFILLVTAIFALIGCTSLPESLPFVPTSTPTPTNTLTPTPTSSPTPTPTPIPTLAPATRIEDGEYALFIGDWNIAQREYTIALETAPEPEIQHAALLGIARSQYEQGLVSDALVTTRNLLAENPENAVRAYGFYLLANIYEDLDRYAEAAVAYDSYLTLRPNLLDDFVAEWMGDAWFADGNYTDAKTAYVRALDFDPSRAERLKIKLAQAEIAETNYPTALEILTEVRQNTANDYTKAETNRLIANLYLLDGDTEQAYSLLQESVNNYPLSYDAYLALVTLVDAGEPVDEYMRGLINYYVGQDSLAIAAFDRALLDETQPINGAIYYYKGLALRNLELYADAIAAWDVLIDNFTSEEPTWDNAWQDKGYTQWAFTNDYPGAIETFTGFAARVPDHPRAPEFVYFAAQVAERNGSLELAASLWERVGSEYPLYGDAFRAWFLSGIAHYRLEAYASALRSFQQAIERNQNLFEQSAATFWTGKAQFALGDESAARTTWEQTTAIDPTGYYSERARDLLLAREPFATPVAYDLAIDVATEKTRAEDWMRITFFYPETHDFSKNSVVESDLRYVRGLELWHLGEYEFARQELESLRLAIADDPAANYFLANKLIDLGLYRTAIFAARQVLSIAGMSDAETMGAPTWFNHIRFGTYYRELIVPAAQEQDFHPLLVYSLVRQESLFEGFVRSSAGARGLMQIIPSTGQGIATNMGLTNYTSDDLYRPVMNVPMGTRYLADQRNFFDGNLYAALAAYNGGPGNSLTWLRLSGDDLDLFAEVVRFGETRLYIRSIYEIFSIYRRIYAREP